MEPEENVFYADEFFITEDDQGVEVNVRLRGRDVPFRIKRGLTLEDELAAQAVAIKKQTNPDGSVTILGTDEAVLVIEMVFRILKSWPFTDRSTGQPFPITRENIKKLMGGAAEQLVEKFQALQKEGEAALVPFVAASANPSETSA